MAFHHRDQFAKSVIEDYALDILRFFYPEADKLFDFTKEIEFLESEHLDFEINRVTSKAAVRIDKVLKVHLHSGEITWIVIGIEIQGYKDISFPERVFDYFTRLFNKFGKRVVMLTIFTGAGATYAEDSFTYSLLGTNLAFNFKTFRISNEMEAELAYHPNPVALLFLGILIGARNSRKKAKKTLLNEAIQLAETVYQRDISETMKAKLLKTIVLYFNFEDTEIQSKFGERINTITNKIKSMGVFEYAQMIAVEEAKEIEREKSRKETKQIQASFVRGLLQRTSLSISQIAEIAGVPIEFVKSINEGLYN